MKSMSHWTEGLNNLESVCFQRRRSRWVRMPLDCYGVKENRYDSTGRWTRSSYELAVSKVASRYSQLGFHADSSPKEYWSLVQGIVSKYEYGNGSNRMEASMEKVKGYATHICRILP